MSTPGEPSGSEFTLRRYGSPLRSPTGARSAYVDANGNSFEASLGSKPVCASGSRRT